MSESTGGLRIGMFGMWGMNVPGRHFAGFESIYSELAPRLVALGHDVVIYCRKHEYSTYQRLPQHRGVRLVYVPSRGGKNLSGPISTLRAVMHALKHEAFDIFFFVNVGMGFHCALARAFGKRVVLNVDGLDWKRGKWGPLGRAYFYVAAHAAVRSCHRIITDAESMREFYRDHFGIDTTMISYAADVETSSEPQRIAKYGLEPGEYYLIVARLIPENNLELLIRAYLESGTRKKLVIAGSAMYRTSYERKLHALVKEAKLGEGRVLFTGHVHDQATLRELWCNCFAYLHGHSVGGTNPALLRAMGYGSCVLALHTVFNREVVGGAGRLFPHDVGAVAEMMRELEGDPALVEELRGRGPVRIRRFYNWERVTEQYDRLFREVAARASQPRRVTPVRIPA